MDLVDGFDSLPDDVAEKVKRALEQGHVDDEDWNGVGEMRILYTNTTDRNQDIELNRYDPSKSRPGMFLNKKQKAAKKKKVCAPDRLVRVSVS